MSIKPMCPHYSFEGHPTIFDEEALTALELAGRTAGKVNEVVEAVNEFIEYGNEEMNAQREKVIPQVVTAEVDKHLKAGEFDRQIDEHLSDFQNGVQGQLNNMENRLTNLSRLPEGSTTRDVELADIRNTVWGTYWPTAGEAVRGQMGAMKAVTDMMNGTLLTPVYSDSPVEPVHLLPGAFFNLNDMAVTPASDLAVNYGLVIFPVEAGREYWWHVKRNTGNGLHTPVIASNLTTSGGLVGAVTMPENAQQFTAPKTGYLYVNYADSDKTNHNRYCLEKVVGYTPKVAPVEGTRVTVPYEYVNGQGLAKGPSECYTLVEGNNYKVYITHLAPGTYYAPFGADITVRKPQKNTYTAILATVANGTTFTVDTPCYAVSATGPVEAIRAISAGDLVEVESPAETLARNGTVKCVYGDVIPYAGVLKGVFSVDEPGIISIGGDRYELFCYPVEKGKRYVLECDYYNYPTDIYPLFGFMETGADAEYRYAPRCYLGPAKTVGGAFRHAFTAPIDGYLYVSHDADAPSYIRFYGVESATMTLRTGRKYKKMLCVGDSLGGNYGLWQDKVCELLGISEYTTAGDAGLCVANIGDNSIYSHVMRLTPDPDVELITFWGGYNDFNSGAVEPVGVEAGTPPHTSEANQFSGGAGHCIARLLNIYPNAQIVVIGTTPFFWPSSGDNWRIRKNRFSTTISDYVNILHDVADWYSLPFLDLLHTCGFNEFNASDYYLDQGYYLHPNEKGNDRLAHHIAGFINSLG